MNKKLTQRLLASFAIATMVVASLSAQVADANFTAIDGDDDGLITSAGGIDTVSVSATVASTSRYYVEPDGYFHPNYNVGGAWALTPGFTWNWAIAPAGPVLAVTDNYVNVTYAAGTADGTTYRITANEQAPAGFGGCAGIDTNMWVRVISTPTVTYTGSVVGTTIGADITVCENDPALAGVAQAAFTHYMNQLNDASFQLDYDLEIYTVDNDGASNILYWPFDLSGAGSGPAVLAVDSTQGSADEQVTGIDAATWNLAKPAAGFVAHDDNGATKRRTVYTYNINGVNDRISRKSEYLSNGAQTLANWTFHDATTETVVITVNPAPVTGPIYHIPNMWAN